MYSVVRRSAAGAHTTLCQTRRITGVRWASDAKAEDEMLHRTATERAEMERKRKKLEIREAHKQRLMGVKKEVIHSTGKKTVDKKKFEKLMMPVIEKHLREKKEAQTTITNQIQPIPQTYTEDEQEYLDMMTPTDPEELQQEKGENDDDFWERRALATLPRYDWVTPALERAPKPGRNYAEIARKLQLSTFGDPDRIKDYMRYPEQKEPFVDEKRSVTSPTTMEDVKDHEMVIRIQEKRDGRDYANNIQKAYNRVQKFKAQQALEMEAMGIKPPQPPVQNSKFSGKFQISAAVILERYPTLTPPLKPHEIEHEEWEQNIRKQTCIPVIPWYIWKLQFERVAESLKRRESAKGPPKGAKAGGGGGGTARENKDAMEEKSSKKKSKGGQKQETSVDDLPRLKIGPPDWGLPNTNLPDPTPEELAEQKSVEDKKLKPYNDWLEYWKNWKAAPRETKDDLDDNRKSTNRALHKKLYLIIKRKSDGVWLFPNALNQEDESIRMTAERGLKVTIGKGLTTYFNSNAPVGFYNSYFPTEQEQEKQQAESDKIFYMRARYFNGTPDPMRRAGYDDYLWVTREQLAEYLPKEYHDRVINFIWPDPN